MRVEQPAKSRIDAAISSIAEERMIRRYQKGSVRKRNGNYVLRYRADFIKTDGTRGRQQCSTILGPISAFRGKKDARRAADEIMRAVNQNTPIPQASITLGDFWDRYFKPNIVEKMKRNTRQMYQDRWRKQIAPPLSSERMRNLTTLDLDRFMAQLQRQDIPGRPACTSVTSFPKCTALHRSGNGLLRILPSGLMSGSGRLFASSEPFRSRRFSFSLSTLPSRHALRSFWP